MFTLCLKPVEKILKEEKEKKKKKKEERENKSGNTIAILFNAHIHKIRPKFTCSARFLWQTPLWDGKQRSGGGGVRGRARGEDVLSENKDMGGKMLKWERKKRIRRREVGRDCVGLKSWHLSNRAAALGAKCCQPAPLAWISALPLSLFAAWHFASSLFYAFLFTLYQRSISS